MHLKDCVIGVIGPADRPTGRHWPGPRLTPVVFKSEFSDVFPKPFDEFSGVAVFLSSDFYFLAILQYPPKSLRNAYTVYTPGHDQFITAF